MHQVFIYMKEGSGLENIFKKLNNLIPNKVYWWKGLEYVYVKCQIWKLRNDI
jgi:hypothetical protein